MTHLLKLLIVLYFLSQYFSSKSILPNPFAEVFQLRHEVHVRPITTSTPTDTTDLVYFFVDSLHVGKRKLNKIEISKFGSEKGNYTIVKFYSKQKNWVLRNKFKFKDETLVITDTKLSDFNNDGLNDITYVSIMPARGANEVRKLFIYDKLHDKIIFIKNSEDFPNMLYNKELNCIDAFLVYGGCSTVFLKIKGDSLIEFASVELVDGLTVKTYNRNGIEKIIFQDTSNKAGYIRYKSFKPLKEYDVY